MRRIYTHFNWHSELRSRTDATSEAEAEAALPQGPSWWHLDDLGLGKVLLVFSTFMKRNQLSQALCRKDPLLEAWPPREVDYEKPPVKTVDKDRILVRGGFLQNEKYIDLPS